MSTTKKIISFLQEFSIPLILGVIIAIAWANLSPESYHHFVHTEIAGPISLHFFVNDIFMVFFFAMATVEIAQSFLPGGSLNPVKRAISPLMASFGGVIGPAVVFLGLNALVGSPEFARGWGIPTATDIALAWLVARVVFGAVHPAVSFLLLLAIVDDGIGLMIIAFFYPDPANPVNPIYLLLTVAGMLVAYLLKRKNVQSYWPYITFGGLLSWAGLYLAHIHPALALVFIVPFLPNSSTKDKSNSLENCSNDHSTLKTFEHDWKIFVDFGLLLFGLTNAGVQFSGISMLTWLIFIALLGGKTIGIFLLGILVTKLGFPLPKGMGYKELFVAGIIAAMGLTVALFVSGVAFIDPSLQGAAKMGALFSAAAAVIAIIAGKLLGIKKVHEKDCA